MKLAEILSIWKKFLSETALENLEETEALDEDEDFQKAVKNKHKSMKKRLIKLGKQKNTPPFTKKPSYERSKSASADFGGS